MGVAVDRSPEGLPQASGGRKEHTDDEGNVSRVVEWFGFKLHLSADVKHEVALAYRITGTKVGDGETLPLILADAQDNLPANRTQTLAYDKAADTTVVHRKPCPHCRHMKPERCGESPTSTETARNQTRHVARRGSVPRSLRLATDGKPTGVAPGLAETSDSASSCPSLGAG